jgi:transposase-like protein
VADELGIRRKLLYEWRHAYRKHGVAGLNRKRGPKPGSKGSGSPPGRASRSWSA